MLTAFQLNAFVSGMSRVYPITERPNQRTDIRPLPIGRYGATRGRRVATERARRARVELRLQVGQPKEPRVSRGLATRPCPTVHRLPCSVRVRRDDRVGERPTRSTSR